VAANPNFFMSVPSFDLVRAVERMTRFGRGVPVSGAFVPV
jgi:hypothetical protein